MLERGAADVYLYNEEWGEERRVHSYQPGSAFGELALLYSAPRAATVKAIADGKLWVSGRARAGWQAVGGRRWQVAGGRVTAVGRRDVGGCNCQTVDGQAHCACMYHVEGRPVGRAKALVWRA